MNTVCAVLDGQLHAREHTDTGFARPFAQRLKFFEVKFVVVGDDSKAYSGSFKRLYIACDETVIIAVIAKFLICSSVQVKICPYPLCAMFENFLKSLTQS
ncbi:hypothetical protein C357_00414 [Citreicella sp. 357]|nr:hypothetical protein C357_00414 [Citreicella sp. 357]